MKLKRRPPAAKFIVLCLAFVAGACAPAPPPAASTPGAALPSTATPEESGQPAAAPTPTSSAPAAQACIPSGDHSSIQNALTGPGAQAVLCPNAVFELNDTINFTAENQEIYTQGLPTDDSRALFRIVHKDVATAVSMNNQAGVKLHHVIIDGNRPALGTALSGLIEAGGNGAGTVVEWVKAYEPRGWSVLVIGHGDGLVCEGAIARNNELGPAGSPISGMADGISLACRNSVVENNTIVDATDGGIVIFQAPGSLIANNTIIAENRILFYGISMVDTGPYDGDFTGTRVTGNTIDARGALIRHGIDMGASVGCIPPEEATFRSHGAVVTDNTLMGDHMAYGFVVSGVEEWTVTGNIDLSTHLKPTREVGCFGSVVDPPGGFQLDPATSSGDFQAEFEEAVLGFTTNWWPADALFSEACLRDLIGAETLEDIKAGRRGSALIALETAENGELIGQCMSIYQPPETPDSPTGVIIGLYPCEPFCAEVALINVSDQVVDMRSAEFLLEGFLVECIGLPEFIQPGEEVRCIIEDYVTEGFQVLRWFGFPPAGEGWGFEYPFEPEPSPAPSATPVYDIFAPGGLGDACASNPNPRFTAHITDLSQIAYLTPAGTVQGGDLKPHGFLHNKPGVAEVPVYAPVDSYLIDFAYYAQDGYSIYTFKFQVSCEVAYYVDHLQAVVDKIGALMPASPAADSRGTPVSPPLFFQAGELIGVTGDTPLSRNWDFGVLNATQWNPLPTDKSFDVSGNADKYRYAVCPYEYYDESMRAQYDALLGGQGCGP